MPLRPPIRIQVISALRFDEPETVIQGSQLQVLNETDFDKINPHTSRRCLILRLDGPWKDVVAVKLTLREAPG